MYLAENERYGKMKYNRCGESGLDAVGESSADDGVQPVSYTQLTLTTKA